MAVTLLGLNAGLATRLALDADDLVLSRYGIFSASRRHPWGKIDWVRVGTPSNALSIEFGVGDSSVRVGPWSVLRRKRMWTVLTEIAREIANRAECRIIGNGATP